MKKGAAFFGMLEGDMIWVILFYSTVSVAAAVNDPFSREEVITITIFIEPAGITSLRETPRGYVQAKVGRGTNALGAGTVRLKGNYSFRPIDEKPSFSLKLSSPEAQNQFGGHKKLLLNNSLQDPSFLRYKLASEMFLKAELPAARINFARVTLNGRDLGLYLLVEATDEKFLALHFGSHDGNLYEGSNQDVGDPLEIDSTFNGTDRSDLRALHDLCTIENATKRWAALKRDLDVERFASFMAMEVLVGHRDGYSMDINNYRLYYNLTSRQFVFVPHGMDLTFENPRLGQDRPWRGIVAQSLYEMPEGRQMYKKRLIEWSGVFYGKNSDLSKRVADLMKVIEPSLTGTEKQRIVRAAGQLKTQLNSRKLSLPRFIEGVETE